MIDQCKNQIVATCLAAGRESSSLLDRRPTLLDDWVELVNDDGADVYLGGNKRIFGFAIPGVHSGDYAHLYYCGRFLGEDAIPGSDGHCGPDDGPQCASCRRFQAALDDY